MSPEDFEIDRFSFSRSLNVSKRVLRQITRDHRTFAMIVIMPIVIMFIFGYALSGEVTDVPIMIDNSDAGAEFDQGLGSVHVNMASNIVEKMQDDERVDITMGSFSDGIDEVESGGIKAVILFPANFSESVANMSTNPNQKIVISVYIDGTKPQTQISVMRALQDAIKEVSGGRGFNIETEFAFGGAEYDGLETGTPAVMGFVLTFLALLISLLILIRERIEGTQYRLYSTPLTARERLVGYVLALTLLSLLMAGSIMTISIVLFQVPVQGSLSLLIFTTIFYALTNVLLAVFLSNFAENELQAVQLAPLIGLPSMALSGMLVPVSTLPDFIQPISRIVPLTYAVEIFEGIMLKGWGFAELMVPYLVLFGLAVVLLVAAILTVKDHQE